MRTPTTANIIKELTSATYGEAGDPRMRYLFAQALHALVRLARAEQMAEIKKNVEKTAGARQTKAVLRKIGMGCNTPRQGQLEFERSQRVRAG
jgi:hypothetical protein